MMIQLGRHALPGASEKEGLTLIGESTSGRAGRATEGSSTRYRSPTGEDTSTHHEESPQYGGPRIELLVIPDCPYTTLAETLITVALHELGLTRTPVLTTVIETTAEAVRRGFTGSPSIVINGVDPWAHPDGEVGLTCRNHPSPAGLPTPRSLAQALCTAVLDDHRVHR